MAAPGGLFHGPFSSGSKGIGPSCGVQNSLTQPGQLRKAWLSPGFPASLQALAVWRGPLSPPHPGVLPVPRFLRAGFLSPNAPIPKTFDRIPWNRWASHSSLASPGPRHGVRWISLEAVFSPAALDGESSSSRESDPVDGLCPGLSGAHDIPGSWEIASAPLAGSNPGGLFGKSP